MIEQHRGKVQRDQGQQQFEQIFEKFGDCTGYQ
jgi:hypothetical protein